jgi:phospholipid/cholesterol/gamma-HCH transport system permease protein
MNVRTLVLAPADAFHGAVCSLGDLTAFSLRALRGLRSLGVMGRTLIPVCYSIGVRSVFVVCLTGGFIGMVLAVQAYSQFHQLGLDSWLGSIINLSVIRELGPVLASVMLAGRVGSAMAAEIATMRVTEQIDALACLGVNPVHYLVLPRFVACVFLIPLLTAVADLMGVLGGAAVCINVYHIEPHHFWQHGQDYVGMWDVLTGMLKTLFFGAAIALISCHRGFHSKPGAEGVGRASTEAFVASFIAILALDFSLGMFLNTLSDRLFPGGAGRF